MDITLVIGIAAGAVFANAIASMMKKLSMGKFINTVSGAIGGGIAYKIFDSFAASEFSAPLAGMTAATSNLDIGAAIMAMATGGAGGIILTGILGKAFKLIKQP